MAAGSTYTPIATTTLGSAVSSYTFSSIPSTYTDLVLVINGTSSGTNINYGIRCNGDTATNYSSTRLYGDGTSASSDRLTSNNNSITSNLNGSNGTVIYNFMNYSNTTTYKSFLVRSNTNAYVWANVGLWRSTSAINSIQYLTTTGSTLQSGTTLTLYGIASA